jgi:hypothetical protein
MSRTQNLPNAETEVVPFLLNHHPRTHRFSKYNIDGIGEYVPDRHTQVCFVNPNITGLLELYCTSEIVAPG